jgi:hypothetical protein
MAANDRHGAAQTTPPQDLKRTLSIIVALIRGYVPDREALVAFYKERLTDKDFVMPVFGSAWNYADRLPGSKVASAGMIAGVRSAASHFKGQAGWIACNLQYFPTMPSAPRCRTTCPAPKRRR